VIDHNNPNWGKSSWGTFIFGSGWQIDDYLNLITSQYQNSLKFLAWLRVVLQKLNDATALLATMATYFDLDLAIGSQLDVLGQYLNQSRILSFIPAGQATNVLGDSDYRFLLKATVIKNNWNGKVPSYAAAWAMMMPDGQIFIDDNQDMTMTVYVAGNFSAVKQSLIENGLVVPKPAGVLLNYYFGVYPVFGYDLANSYVAGYDVGTWFSPG
jgi:hypothetical protein